MGFKYIVITLDTPNGLRQLPFIFPDSLAHITVAGAAMWIPGIREYFEQEKAGCLSAGSISLTAHSCDDGSETLEVESDPEDAKLVNLFPYFHGMRMPEELEQAVLTAIAEGRAPKPATGLPTRSPKTKEQRP